MGSEEHKGILGIEVLSVVHKVIVLVNEVSNVIALLREHDSVVVPVVVIVLFHVLQFLDGLQLVIDSLNNFQMVVVVQSKGHAHDLGGLIHNILYLVSLGVQYSTGVWVLVVLVNISDFILDLIQGCYLVSVLYNVS